MKKSDKKGPKTAGTPGAHDKTVYVEIGGAWPDPTKQEIHLECPPGEPRPGDLIAELIDGTGLSVRKDVSRVYGHWTWDYSDVPRSVWDSAVPSIERRMRYLSKTGVICAGGCGGFTSRSGTRHVTDSQRASQQL
jgi:hypothetical protein